MKGFEQYKTAVMGCDHADFEFKEGIKDFLQEKNFRSLTLIPNTNWFSYLRYGNRYQYSLPTGLKI